MGVGSFGQLVKDLCYVNLHHFISVLLGPCSYTIFIRVQLTITPLNLWLSKFEFQISGRLFSDSGPRRSTRLAGEAGSNANANASSVAGNGSSIPSKYLGGSKLSSMALRSVTVRKSQAGANEKTDEGEMTFRSISFT